MNPKKAACELIDVMAMDAVAKLMEHLPLEVRNQWARLLAAAVATRDGDAKWLAAHP